MFEIEAELLENLSLGPRLFKMKFHAPKLCDEVEPGQFVHIQLNGFEAHILRRPISVYRVNREEQSIELIVQEVGEGTRFMAQAQAGAHFNMLGPVGHGWKLKQRDERVLIVGGGVGAAPLYMFTQLCVERGVAVEVVLGAQTKDALVTYEDYKQLLGREPLCATDDGSFGRAGFCTVLVEEALSQGAFDAVYVCGPEPLMRIVAQTAVSHKVSCQVSMEKRMACGVGACLSCVVDTTEGRKRSCVDGPVFDAAKVVW